MRYDRFVLDQELYVQGSSGDTFVSKMMTTMYTFKCNQYLQRQQYTRWQ